MAQYEAASSWRIAVTAANAYRGAARLDEALSYYQRAVQLEPQHATTYLDIGDLMGPRLRALFEVEAR